MVSVKRLVSNSLFLAAPSYFSDVAVPQQASDQYSLLTQLRGAGPYVQHPGFGVAVDTPANCQLEQVQVISRHGERYPTTGAGRTFEAILDKFHGFPDRFEGSLAFLNDYEYFVSDPSNYDQETTPANSAGVFSGTTNALRHGAFFRSKYNELFDPSQPLNVFTTNSNRVYQTSNHFARGFLGDGYGTDSVNYVILSEDQSIGANSLSPKDSCDKFSDGIDISYIARYDSLYLDRIAARLNGENKGLDLSRNEVLALFDWCAYEINVKGSSPFCGIFSNDEFILHSYRNDLMRYYSFGEGNPQSKWASSQLLNASLALLNQKTPSENNGKIWLSFTHDTDIESFHAALGIVSPQNPLPNDHTPFPSPYKVSSIVPQGARTYTEKYTCHGESYVRYIVNDAVIPVPKCSTGPGFSCPLEKFNEYVNKRLAGKTYAEACGNSERPEKLTFYWDYQEKNYSAPLDHNY